MNGRLRRTLDAIFETPTRPNIKFADIERLMIALGGTLFESKGSVIRIVFPDGIQFNAHRPHPHKEAKRYQVEDARTVIKLLGKELK